MSSPKEQLVQARKKRGHVRAHLTRLGERITATDRPEIARLETKINELDTEFSALHENIIELGQDCTEAQRANKMHVTRMIGGWMIIYSA